VSPPGTLGAVAAAHGTLVFGRRVRVLAGALAPLLPPGPLADVGCGSGAVSAAIAAARPEVAPEGFDVLLRPGCAIPARAFDGRSLPLPGDGAAAALLVDVLHHASDPVALLAECARVAPVVVVKDHLSRGAFDEKVLAFMDWVGNRPHGVVLPYRYFSPASWTAAVTDAGLREERREPVPGLYPFPFSALFGRGLHFVSRLARR